MIQKMQIVNFRNLANTTLEFQNQTSIICGKNSLGKSNSLNALMWLLTGTILTDKWGSGENDVDSIIPINNQLGAKTEVSIWDENNTKFTKRYACKYDKTQTKVIGHTTEYLINDVKYDTETQFYNELYRVLEFTPVIKSKEIKEANLFIDPLYALQKLDAKVLRQLLVEIGCSVTNEEMYQSGFEDLRQYEAQYFGKWDVMRKNLKTENKELCEELKDLTSKHSTVADAVFNEEEFKTLEAKQHDVVAQMSRLKDNNTSPEIAELEKQILLKEKDIENKRLNHYNEVKNYKAEIEIEIKALQLEIDNKYREDTKVLEDKNAEIVHDINITGTNIAAYTREIESAKELMKKIQEQGKDNHQKQTDASIKLEEVRKQEYQMARCPICGSEFAPDEEAFELFEKHKQQEISELSKTIEDCIINHENLKAEYERAKKKKEELGTKLEEATNHQNDLRKQALEISSKIFLVQKDEALLNKVKELKEEQLKNPALDTSVEDKELLDLQLKLMDLKNNAAKVIEDKISSLQEEYNNIGAQLGDLYVAKSKAADKVEYEKKLQANREKLNANEHLLGRVNEFIQTMIDKINLKATEITGLTFVMLEENLTNDGVKEVCYATINGVAFKDVNTASKLIHGVDFINRLKAILGHNNLPILMDRVEGVDDDNKLKAISDSQIVCTKVTNDERMVVR